MEVRTEKHKTKKALFKRIDEVLKENGIYDIEQQIGKKGKTKGYSLTYWFHKALCTRL